MRYTKLFMSLVLSATLIMPVLGTTTMNFMTEEDAVKLASTYVPEGSEYIKGRAEKDGGYEVKFYSKKTKEIYEITIDRKQKAIDELESEMYERFSKDAPNRIKNNKYYVAKIKETQIAGILEAFFNDVVVEEVALEKDSGYWVYEVDFSSKEVSGTVVLDPENGRIVERDLDYKLVGEVIKPTKPGTSIGKELTLEQVLQLVEKNLFKGATLVSSQRVEKDQIPHYELKYTVKTYYAEVVVNAITGEVESLEMFTTKEIAKDAVNSCENGRYVGKFTKNALEKIVKNYYTSAEIKEVKMGVFRNVWAYDVSGTTAEGSITAWICPETGEILSLNYQKDKVETTPDPSIPPTEENNQGFITKEKVKEIVKKIAPNAVIIKIELDKEDGKWVYEVEAEDKDYEYEIEIDAKTGKVLDIDKDSLEEDED